MSPLSREKTRKLDQKVLLSDTILTRSARHGEPLAQRTHIIAELKKALRESGHTYADVARKLQLSVASVKRLFSTEDLSLHRVDQICELIGLDLRAILDRAADRTAPTNQLTLAQESELVSDAKLLFMTWLVLIRTPFEEVIQDYRF